MGKRLFNQLICCTCDLIESPTDESAADDTAANLIVGESDETAWSVVGSRINNASHKRDNHYDNCVSVLDHLHPENTTLMLSGC